MNLHDSLARIPGSSYSPSGLLLAPLALRRAFRTSKALAEIAFVGAASTVVVLPWVVYLAG